MAIINNLNHFKMFCGIVFLTSLARAGEPQLYKAPNGFELEVYSREFTQHHLANSKLDNELDHELEVGGEDINNDLPDQKALFPWVPNGANTKPTSYACTHEALHDLMWKSSRLDQQTASLQKWFATCHKQNTKLWQRHSYLPIFRFATVYYPLRYHPNVRYVRVKLPDGRRQAGFLALKPGNKPRPFVVAKCGVFCSADNGVLHRSVLMHLFDESPFNVLTLANISGADFQIDNKAMSVGGFDEGRQIYQIAEFLKSTHSPVQKLISSLHIVGASLGGHGALYSSLYASLNLPSSLELFEAHRQQPLINSTIAMCPVVVLENSTKRLFSKGAVSTAASQVTINHLKHLFPYIPVLGQFIEVTRKVNKDRLYKGLTKAIVEYYKQFTLSQNWELEPFKNIRVQDLATFWQLNDFTRYQNLVKIPTLVIASQNDNLVHAKENADLLRESSLWNPQGAIQYLKLQDGGHCAFSVANGWSNFSQILRTFILSHSPEVWVEGHLLKKDFEQYLHTRSAPLVDFVFEPALQKGFLKLRLIYDKKNWRSYGCEVPVDKPEGRSECKYETVSLLPIAELPYAKVQILNEEFHLNQLVRYANTRFKLLDDHQVSVRLSHKNPKYLHWIEYN